MTWSQSNVLVGEREWQASSACVQTGQVELAALDCYELRHLPAHLAAGNLDNDLHALMALDAAASNGRTNAWFAAKEAIGDAPGYSNDIALAAQAAATKAVAAVAAGHTGVEVGLMVRYALVGAALTTLAVNLPGEFLVELVRHERWSPEYALANARRQSDAWARGRALALLSDVAAPPEQRRALEDALASVAEIAPNASDPWHLANERAGVLVLLAERLPADLIPTAFTQAREITVTSGRCRALAALARRVDEDEKRAVLQEVVDAFEHDVGSGSLPFELLATNVSDDLLPDVIAAARAVPHPYQRSEALVALSRSSSSSHSHRNHLYARCRGWPHRGSASRAHGEG